MKHTLRTATTIFILSILALASACGGHVATVEPAAQAQALASKKPQAKAAPEQAAEPATIVEHEGHFDVKTTRNGQPVTLVEFATRELAEKYLAKMQPAHECGALTKSGTRCTRRVKGAGYCWQHKSQEKPPADE
jgi:hypothetical protein